MAPAAPRLDVDRVLHQMLQKQLCWSAAGEVLCSVGTDNVIYAWHVDQQASVFQVCACPLSPLSSGSLTHRVAPTVSYTRASGPSRSRGTRS